MKKILIYTAVFIIGFAAVSLWCFYLIISPPEIKVERNVVNMNLPRKTVELTTEDGIKLSAWYIAPQEDNQDQTDKKALILLHGYPAEKSDMLGMANALYPEFSLLLVDLRSFGESEGTYTTLGIKEQKDVTTAVKFLKKKGYEKIGIFGLSLGSNVALLSAEDNKDIDAVGIDASFADIRTLGYKTYSSLWIVKYPLVEAMSLWGKLFFGKSIDKTLYEAADKLQKPMLLTHTQKGPYSTQHALKLKEVLKNNKKTTFYFPYWRQQQNNGPPTLEWHIKKFFQENL